MSLPTKRFGVSRAFPVTLCLALSTLVAAPVMRAQDPAPRVPSARLIRVPATTFPTLADSNSPAVWDRIEGQQRLFVFTSESGATMRLEGADGTRLSPLGSIAIDDHPGDGVWFEAIVPDVDGAWYAFYHNERPARVCDNLQRTIPRIGAARSTNHGATWQNLGVVLTAPPRSYECGSGNEYFLGGVGDFSVMLDDAQQYLYFFFSQYANRDVAQGVSVARMPWADRDAPAGKVSVWLRDQTWLPAREFRSMRGVDHIYPAGRPIYPVTESWHNGATVDAFWGPSVHWNTYLQQYVMLLNRAKDSAWAQEGIYVAFAPQLDQPASWSTPQKLLTGGRWYPQVLGTEVGSGTDRLAGERARLFIGGRSEYTIQFSR
jgi:hypothetical protein